MASPTHRAGGFTSAVERYWWVSTLGGFYFAGGFMLWGGTAAAIASSSVFFVAALLGLFFHYRGAATSRGLKVALIVGHLLLGQAVLVWQKAWLPLSDYSATGNAADREFIIYVVSALGCALAWNWSSLVAFRLLGGVAIGGSSVAAPMYIAEISPAALRGRLVALSQLNIVSASSRPISRTRSWNLSWAARRRPRGG